MPESIILANITWNPHEWKNNKFINPKAGHTFAKTNVGAESLNFDFGKKGVDTEKFIYGFVQWTSAPIRLEKDALIIFFTNNTDERKGQIVGVYGKAEIFKEYEARKVPFQKDEYLINIKAERDFSLLFPIPLDANDFKVNPSKRAVGQVGFTYKEKEFAERVLLAEFTKLIEAGVDKEAFDKLTAIYEHYIEKKLTMEFVPIDEREQKEWIEYYMGKDKLQLIEELENLRKTDPEKLTVQYKAYKRENKAIAIIKLMRGFKCQICGTSITKKDGSKYIESAHIQPKHKKGVEALDNIILLCPNHHKEFDLGDLDIIYHDNKTIKFKLNGVAYEIELSI